MFIAVIIITIASIPKGIMFLSISGFHSFNAISPAIVGIIINSHSHPNRPAIAIRQNASITTAFTKASNSLSSCFCQLPLYFLMYSNLQKKRLM